MPEKAAAVAAPTPEPAPTPAAEIPAAPQPAIVTEPAPAAEPAATPAINKSLEEMSSADLMNMSDDQLAELEASLPSLTPAANNNAPAEPAAPAAVPTEPAAAPAVPTVENHTPSDAEIIAAIAKATGQTVTPAAPAAPAAAAPVAEPTVTPAAQPGAEAAPAQQPTVAEQVAYLQGQIEALKGATPAAAPAEPAIDPKVAMQTELGKMEQVLASVDINMKKQLIELGTQVEKGELDMPAFLEKQFELQDNASALKDRINGRISALNSEINAPDPAMVEQNILSNPALKAWTADLEEKNPWVSALSKPMVEQLRVQALQDMEKMGLSTNTVEGNWNLRVRIVELGKEMGYEQMLAPIVAAAQQPQPPVPTPGATPANPGAVPGAVPTPDQRAAKLDLAANHPPSVTTAGVSMPTDATATAHIETMTARDLAALPDSVLDGLTGGI